MKRVAQSATRLGAGGIRVNCRRLASEIPELVA